MAGIGKYKKGAKFTLRSGNKPSFFQMGSSPLQKGGYGREAQNLLKAVPNKEAYDKLSDTDKKGFDKAAKKANLPMKKNKKSSLQAGEKTMEKLKQLGGKVKDFAKRVKTGVEYMGDEDSYSATSDIKHFKKGYKAEKERQQKRKENAPTRNYKKGYYKK